MKQVKLKKVVVKTFKLIKESIFTSIRITQEILNKILTGSYKEYIVFQQDNIWDYKVIYMTEKELKEYAKTHNRESYYCFKNKEVEIIHQHKIEILKDNN